MNSCCFTYTSKKGSILSAVCSVGGALLLVGHTVYDIHQVKCPTPTDINLTEVCQEYINRAVASIIFETWVPCLLFMIGGGMTIGIAKNCAGLLLPWLMLNTVSVSILAIGAFWSVLTVLAGNISTSNLGKHSVTGRNELVANQENFSSATFLFSIRLGLFFINIHCIHYVTSLYYDILNSKALESVPDANMIGIINCEKEKQLTLDKGDSSVEHVYIHNEPPPTYTVYRHYDTDLCSECNASMAARAPQGRIKE